MEALKKDIFKKIISIIDAIFLNNDCKVLLYAKEIFVQLVISSDSAFGYKACHFQQFDYKDERCCLVKPFAIYQVCSVVLI